LPPAANPKQRLPGKDRVGSRIHPKVGYGAELKGDGGIGYSSDIIGGV